MQFRLHGSDGFNDITRDFEMPLNTMFRGDDDEVIGNLNMWMGEGIEVLEPISQPLTFIAIHTGQNKESRCILEDANEEKTLKRFLDNILSSVPSPFQFVESTLYVGAFYGEVLSSISLSSSGGIEHVEISNGGKISSKIGVTLNVITEAFNKVTYELRNDSNEVILQGEFNPYPEKINNVIEIGSDQYDEGLSINIVGVFDDELYQNYNNIDYSSEFKAMWSDIDIGTEYQDFPGGNVTLSALEDGKTLKQGTYYCSVLDSSGVTTYHYFVVGVSGVSNTIDLPSGDVKIGQTFEEIALSPEELEEWERIQRERELEEIEPEFPPDEPILENPEPEPPEPELPPADNPATNTGDHSGIINAINNLQTPINQMVAEQRNMVNAANVYLPAVWTSFVNVGLNIGKIAGFIYLFGNAFYDFGKWALNQFGEWLGFLPEAEVSFKEGTELKIANLPEVTEILRCFKNPDGDYLIDILQKGLITGEFPNEQGLAEILRNGLVYEYLDEEDNLQQVWLAYVVNKKQFKSGDVIIDGESFTPASMISATGTGGDLG